MKKNSFLAQVFAGLAACLLSALCACNSQPGGDVMATVDGRKIFRTDVDKYYDNNVASAQQPPAGEQAVALRLNILHQMIDDEILMRRAEKLGLLATDEEVDRKFNEIKSPFTQEEFDKRLQEKKISLADFKRDIRRSITVDKVLNKEVSSKINITDQDISDYYNAHKAEFNLIEAQYHLAQIMVTPLPDPQAHNQNDKAQNDAEARKKIQMISNRLDSGDDFATLAMKYSEDPETTGNGGDLGTIQESGLKRTDPATRDAVMKLKPGQYSPIIGVVNPATKQPVGFRIVKLVSKEPAGQRELADPRVQQAIRTQLHDRREQLLKAAYYEVLRDSAKVENYYAKQVLDRNGIEK
ncbi:MAG TPA: SurA N-terminal domain-containing protein [Candidatus Dormibacteraeota bacterium]|nr:SurA N-terminal domain-containing protein [Candidatus Dormibacteraeota bacterium]